jgi:hypothetical protein
MLDLVHHAMCVGFLVHPKNPKALMQSSRIFRGGRHGMFFSSLAAKATEAGAR